MTTPRTTGFITACIAGLGLLAVTGLTQAADVSVRINLPAPVVVLPAPPHMVWLSGPGVYVALDSPHQIFFRDNRYYLFDHDKWYSGPGYGGPWGHIKLKQVPPGLHKHKHKHWDGYQHEAKRRYRDGGDRDHRNFVGKNEHKKQEKAERKRYKDDDDKGRDKDKGKGRDKD